LESYVERVCQASNKEINQWVI